MNKATFGAGCFWGVELAFSQIEGLLSTAVGYTGGHAANPTYELVCAGGSGHAEVVQVEFNPNRVSYENLLEQFWAIHNPTTLNRQGPDVGTQYRSAIFFHDSSQEEIARAACKERQLGLANNIVTEITPAQEFFRAEEYHQQYLQKRGLGNCHS